MKIHFQISGGFAHIPALNKPVSIETTQIDPKEATQLESFVRQSDFFNRSIPPSNKEQGAADYREYTITIEDEARVRTIQLADPITDESLARLVTHLQTFILPKS